MDEFARVAEREFRAVPEEYRRGVAGPVIEKRAKGHPHIPEYWTLGECVPAPHQFTLGEEHLSTVFLYYGSFVACAKRDPSFDVEAEIRETVRHEILHHVEDRAGASDLRDEDEAEEQDERRRQGLSFHPTYYRFGQRSGDGVWRLHHDVFLEVELPKRRAEAARREGLRVRRGEEELEIPAADLVNLPAFVEFEGDEDGEVLIVVVRTR